MPEIKVPCPDATVMGKFACDNHDQCWEPCGALGHSAENVSISTREVEVVNTTEPINE